MAGWVANFLSPKDPESENQASNSTGGGGITSFISGLLWSGGDTSLDFHESAEQFKEGKGTKLDESWEDVDMAELKPKVVASQPKVEVTSSERDRCEVGQQLSDLQKRFENLEGVVQTQGKQIKEHQKGKWPLRLRKQPSKDKGDECAQAIQAKETQIREKESEIRKKDEQLQFYREKLGNAEELDKQSAELAVQLSEKENKLQEVSKQLFHLKQEMKTVMAKNAQLKKQAADDQARYKDEIKKLTAKIQKQDESHIEVVLVGNEDSEQYVRSEKVEVARLRSRIATLEADLDKSVTHSKAQSREILNLKQHIQGTELEKEECLQSSQGLLDDCEGRVSKLQQHLIQARRERDNLKREHDRLSAEVQSTHQALQAETKQRRLLEAQLDDDITQCPKAKCIKVKKDYDTLAAENERLQKNIVHLSSISEEHQQQTQTIVDLKTTMQDLNGKLTTAKLQIQSYKFDFEAERKDREAAHSKLADLERELAREKGHIDIERATYEQRFGEYPQGSKESAASHAELKKQKEKSEKEKGKLEKEVEKLRSDLAKHKVEAEKAREEVRAKVSQVRQYKKESDRLKAQLDQSVASMLKLTDDMEAMRKKAKKKGDEPQKGLSASSLPDKGMAAEKRIAEMEKLCDRFQTENRDLREDVENLTKVNKELKKLLKQDPYGDAAQRDEGQASSSVSPTQGDYPLLGDQISGGPQSLPALGADSHTVGTGELHRQIPNQLPLPSKESHPAAKPTSAPFRARDPERQHQQPPQAVSLYTPKSPSPVIQRGNIAEASNVHGVGSSQLGSPQHAPAQSKLRASYNNPQSAHTYDHTRAQLNEYGQPYITRPVTTPGGYVGEQPSSGIFLPQNPNNQPPTRREGPTAYNPNKYMAGSQSATYPIHPGSDHRPAATASAPQYQYQAQSRPGNQPQHHSQPQSPQAVPGYELNCESATKHKNQKPHTENEPNHETAVSKGQQGPYIQQKPPGYEPNSKTTARREERPERHTQHPDQPPLPPEDNQEDDDEDLRFQNRLQNQVDDEIHQEASEVIQQVSGGHRHIKTDRQRPFDPNLVCPMCMRQFRIGEIQKFKHHVNTCDGTDDPVI